MLPLYSGERKSRSILAKGVEMVKSALRVIFSDSHSRSLCLFLMLNLSFAFIELIWGMMTNSLSLITDSFHMFFDCTGLLAGLIATLITKWRPNEAFSYGYVRAETLAGFVNGMFLVFIAFFIFAEAVERLFEPPEVHHDRLFIVSIMGFIVNLLGMYVFHDVAHGHSHGGGGHGHSHSHTRSSSSQKKSKNYENGNLVSLTAIASESPFTVVPDYYGQTQNQVVQNNNYGHHNHSHSPGSDHGHSHDDHGHSHDGHGHSHDGHGHHEHDHGVHYSTDPIKASDNQIMKGVYLHVLADTLGSVGVIVSAIIMKFTGWMIVDPICSMIISTLIVASVIPLIKDSAGILLMRSPRSLDTVLPGCFQKLAAVQGVYSIQEPHFWTLCSDVYVGTLKLEVSPKADSRYVVSTAHSIFAQIGVRQLYVQLDISAT